MITSTGDTLGPRLEVVRVESERGLVATGLRWDGGPSDRPILLLHPNGFGSGVFAPLGPLLADGHLVIALDLRGHGESTGPDGDRTVRSYLDLANDLLEAIDLLGVRDPVVVGQSLGGAVAVLADQIRPGWARHLALFEPAAYPQRPAHSENPLAEQARRRRSEWTSLAEVLTSYEAKPGLAELSPEALRGYVEHGTRTTGSGTVELSCSPATEAALFELATSPVGGAAALEHLGDLGCSVSISAGMQSFLPASFFEDQATRARTTVRWVAGGHFFLQAHVREAAQLLLEEFDRLDQEVGGKT